jgi:serine kinase of HPr protein (carbohydrate metabolism regulator)
MPALVHGTAVVVGTTGLILLGASGSGKSSMAIRLMEGARRSGHLAGLVSDDQVFVDSVNGRVVATAPETIKGRIELYGSGIGHAETIDHAVLRFALQPVVADSASRIPEENQRWRLGEGITLPLHFIDRRVTDPFPWLASLIPGFPVSGTFQV